MSYQLKEVDIEFESDSDIEIDELDIDDLEDNCDEKVDIEIEDTDDEESDDEEKMDVKSDGEESKEEDITEELINLKISQAQKNKEEKRELTDDEFDFITDFLEIDPELDWEVAINTMQNVKNDLLKQSRGVKMYPSIIPTLKKIIFDTYQKSLISPGHAVGVGGALSMGEPATQMSTHKDEKIIVRSGSKIINTTIGEFIDAIITLSPSIVMTKKKSVIVQANNFGDGNGIDKWEILSVSQQEKINWNKITEVSRHLPHGNLIKVTTESGRVNISTLSHSFLKRTEQGKIIPIKGSKLKIGDRIPVCKELHEFENPLTSIKGPGNSDMRLTSDFGEFLAKCIVVNLTDEHVNVSTKLFLQPNDIVKKWLDENIGLTKSLKKIPSFLYGCEKKFISKVLRSIFEESSEQIKASRNYIMWWCNSKNLIEQISILLSYFGIFTSYYNGNSSNEEENSIWVLSIYGEDNGKLFKDEIGPNIKNKIILDEKYRLDCDLIPFVGVKFNGLCKNLKILRPSIKQGQYIDCISRKMLKKYVALFKKKDITKRFVNDIGILDQAVNANVVWDRIVSLEIIIPDEKEYVYDFSVENDETFALQSGIIVHNTLNTFHLAGTSSANVLVGVPRFNELLNCSKNQKTNVMKAKFLTPSTDLQTTRDKARCICEEKYIDQCIISHDICYRKYDNLNSDKNWYDIFDMFYNTNYKKCDWSIRLVFKKLMVFQYKLTTAKIAAKIENEYKDCHCVFSPDNLCIVDVYVDTSNVDVPSLILSIKKKTKSTTEEKQKKIEEESDEDDEKEKKKKKPEKIKRELITDDNKDYFFMRDVALDHIMNIRLNGIEGITKVFYNQDVKTKEWSIETAGTNMRETMNHPDIDFRYVVSNNMWEIFETLGIEATRRFLIEEFTSIISSGGTFVDPSHIVLLSDGMTYTGAIVSVNRYGIGKDGGVLSLSSFEQSHQNMLEAPAKGLSDNTKSVSAAIILGKMMPLGTNYFDVISDFKKIIKLKIPANKVLSPKKSDNTTKRNDKLFKNNECIDMDSVFKGGVVEKFNSVTKKKVEEYNDY
jgi:intein/homing endonuclease